jgi:predicted HicB family RNase H-like nuclease
MLQKLFELFRSLLFLARDVRENRDDIARLKRQVKDLSDELVQMRSDMQRGFENERHEREKFMLRVENALLRFERSLTEGKSKKRK